MWEDIDRDSQDFIRSYLHQYPEVLCQLVFHYFVLILTPPPLTLDDLAENRSKWQKACITEVQHPEVVCRPPPWRSAVQQKGSTSQSVPAAESSDPKPFTCNDCGRHSLQELASSVPHIDNCIKYSLDFLRPV